MLSDRYGRKKGRWLTTHWLLPEVYVSFHVTSKRQRSTFLSSSKNRRQEICFTALVTTCSDQIGQNLEERKWWGPIIRILFPLNLVMLNFELSKDYDSSQEKKKKKENIYNMYCEIPNPTFPFKIFSLSSTSYVTFANVSNFLSQNCFYPREINLCLL